MSRNSSILHNKGKHKVHISGTVKDQQELVKEYIQSVIEQSSADKNVIIGFSGGSMPQFISPILAEIPNEIVSRLQLFPVDERLVPLKNADSNAGALLQLLPPHKFDNRVLSVPDELADDGFKAAKQFERQLRSLGPPINEYGFPVFDLLLLGLGPDGHTCSLFPGHRLLAEDTVWISHLDDSPKPPPRRITVTLPVLGAARNVAFIANGASKAEMIKAIVADDDKQFPPSQIQKAIQQKPIEWFIDEEAGNKIQ